MHENSVAAMHKNSKRYDSTLTYKQLEVWISHVSQEPTAVILRKMQLVITHLSTYMTVKSC